MSYFEDMIRRLEEIVEIKKLNLELMQVLQDIITYVINYAERKGIPLDDTENLSYLLEQVTTFMRRTNPSSSFVRNNKKSPTDKWTEPLKAF